MTLAHERYVAARFDALAGRFRDAVEAGDYRLAAVVRAIAGGADRPTLAGLRILDLGCGKGRFSRHLRDLGAEVVGLDPSAGMLASAGGIDRVRGSAARLPFASGSFDAAIAIEVIEHIPSHGLATALDEAARVLRPGGRIAIIDKNVLALDARRPWLPKFALKRIDERRGLWMYPAGAPVRERWFRAGAVAKAMRRSFEDVEVERLLSPEESGRAVFRGVPIARLMTLWTARAPGGDDA